MKMFIDDSIEKKKNSERINEWINNISYYILTN